MTHGTSTVAMLVALLTTIAAGACRDDRVTLAVGDGAAGNGGVTGGAGTGGAAGGGAPDAGGIDQGGSTGGAGTGGATDGGPADGPEHNDASPGIWVARTPCVIPSSVPEARQLPMVAFDTDREKLLVFGGESSLGDPLSDLWELDVATATWTSRNDCGATTPPPTTLGNTVYDRGRRKLLLFSGKEGVVWEWDLDTALWALRAPAPGAAVPTGNLQAAVYDDTRGKALVFEYEELPVSPYVPVSFWEWDGGTGAWLLRRDDLPTSFAGQFPAVAFDAGRGTVWMFGGDYGDNLLRLDVASATLTDLTPAVRPADWPPSRTYAEMAYDPVRGRLLLLGGLRDQWQRDLWELDPATITARNRTPAQVPIVGTETPPGVAWPAGELGTGIFADAASGRIVHISDLSYPVPDPALWSWDGASGTWSTRVPAGGARWPRESFARLLAWDSGRGKLLVYDSDFRDLWQWGTGVGRWDRLTPAGAFSDVPASVPWPDSRTGSAVAWDPGASRLVIFGGSSQIDFGAPLGDLWIWDPSSGQMTSPPRPSTGWPRPRFNHAMAYDPVRRRVLMFGGSLPEATDELWTLDTAQAHWERVTPAGDWPSPRGAHMLVLDEDRGVLVLEGGDGTAGSGTLVDTWELAAGASAWQQRSTAGGPRRFPANYTSYASFVRGLGVVAMPLTGAGSARVFALSKWDPTAAAWVAAGVDPPHPVPFAIFTDEAAMAGGGDTLFMLLPGSTSRPAHERAFAETWEWRAP